MAIQVRFHATRGACQWDTEAREWVLGDDGQPVMANRYTGEPIADDRVYVPKSIRIGDATITMDENGTVRFFDPKSKYPPIECVRMGKMRAVVSFLHRTLSRIEEHPQIRV